MSALKVRWSICRNLPPVGGRVNLRVLDETGEKIM
jgi:hypothetical protein